VTWPEKEQPVSVGIYVAMGVASKINRHAWVIATIPFFENTIPE